MSKKVSEKILTTAESFREYMWSGWSPSAITISLGDNVNFIFRTRSKLGNVERTYALPAAKCMINITHHSRK